MAHLLTVLRTAVRPGHPDDEHGRWRLHLALLDASDAIVTRLRSAGETDALLAELTSIDTTARTVVESRLAASKDEIS